ncbi:MAG: UvrD-helicase domain-containing protein, partial [Gammaproteobacteria bacterium]|nr:UvrD-helicase domain-containing protein [Gammaproteobacteria bacterium]
MDHSHHLLNELNAAQREAVSAPLGHLLILAGAGSGKTKVLTQRIAWLIEVERASPMSILAVTFTNKASAEMRGRVERTLSQQASTEDYGRVNSMWIGTFHGIAHKLLRRHWQAAGLMEGFQILDADDQYRLVRRVLKDLHLDEKQWPPKQAQWYINHQKEQGFRAKHIEPRGDFSAETMLKVYQAYEKACDRGGLVDFSELLLRAQELWLNNDDI